MRVPEQIRLTTICCCIDGSVETQVSAKLLVITICCGVDVIRGNSGAIEETRIFIIIVIIFLSQAQREFQRAILQSKASNSPISA